LDPWHTPVALHVPGPWQVPPPLEHEAPGVGTCVTVPVVGSHESAVQGLPSSTLAAAPAQAPAWHTSPLVQALPSLHLVPSLAAGLEQAPVDVSQVPATWHWSLAVHVTGFEPVHAPLTHASVCVHALPSLHEVPSLAAGFEHVPVLGLHVPAV
jgi:hypothetical protein